jgi:cell division protein FtsW
VIGELKSRFGGTRMGRASGRYLETPFASVQLMLAAGGGLLIFGLMMSASTTISASLHTTGNAIWTQLIREVEFLVFSLPVFWIAMRMPPWLYRKLAYPILGLSTLSLLAVLVPHIGTTINSAHRWIQLGPFTVQPSEFAKLAILIWGADLLARKEALKSLDSARHVLLPLVPGFAAMITLVMMEPDLGTSLCFMLLLMGLLWMVGLPLRYFTCMVLVIAGLVTLLAIAEPYRLQRLTTFMHPSVDPNGAGFHTIQGLYALSTGGIFGVGLGQGTSKYGWVPNANTDYVFAVVGEELGLLGALAVLLLFGLFTYAAMRIALRSNDAFVRLVASGAAIWIAGQALINLGYVTALLPVTGIPLPFISNGGTSLILTCGVLGMLVSFARHEPAAVKAAQRSAQQDRVPRWVRWLRLGTPKTAAPRIRTAAPKQARPASASRTAAARTAPAAAPGATPVAAPAGSATASVRTRPAAASPRPAVRRAPQPGRQPAANRPSDTAARLRPTGTESGVRRAR